MQYTSTIELWSPVTGFESVYEVSSQGRVKRLLENGERIIKPFSNKAGYQSVCLCYNGKLKKVTVHRLVASAFVPNPNNLPQINHKDTNKKNNWEYNLEWVTAKQNIQHAVKKGIFHFRRGKPTNFNLQSVKVINTESGKIYESIKLARLESGYSRWIFSEMLYGRKINNSPYKIYEP